MNTAAITIKVDPETKHQAQTIAERMGISLSAVINRYLKQFVKTKAKRYADEVPSPYLIRLMKQAEKDRKAGKGSPIFDNAEDAIAWLHR